MAAETLGELLVLMVLDHAEYDRAIQSAQRGFQQFSSGLTAASTSLNRGIGAAMSAASSAVRAMGEASAEAGQDAADGLGDVAPAASRAGAALGQAGEAANRAAGIFRDASGRLRDGAGRLLDDEEVIRRLGPGEDLAEGDLKLLQERANKIRFDEAKKSADSLISRFQGIASTIQQYVLGALAALGVALTAVGVASAATGVKFEQKMDQVATISGATGEEIAALTDTARELGATTAYSATEAADAMQLLAGAGLTTNQVISATGNVLTLAGAGGTTLDQAAATLASTMAQFNLTAEDSGRIVDVLAKATAASQFTVEDLSEALKYGGVVGAGFGWSLEETTAALAQFRDLGMQGSQAGTALRSAMIGATTASSTNVAVLEKYGLTMEAINPETHSFAEILTTVGKAGVSTTDALTVFGAEAGAAIATLGKQFAQGGKEYQDMLAALEASTGAAAAMTAQMQANVAGAYANLQSAAEEVLLTLYDQYAGPLTALLMAVTEVVNKVAAAIVTRSALIKFSIADSLGALTSWVEANGDYFADMIGDLVRRVADFTRNIGMVLPLLEVLLPLVDEIALGMGLIWVTTQVAAFATAVGEVVTMLNAGALGVKAFSLAMVETTGGMYALVLAIGVLVAGLGTLINRYYEAEEAANKLKAAQDKLKTEETAVNDARVAALEGWFNLNRKFMEQEAQQLAASGQRNSARYQELQTLLKLNGATAAQMEAEGKLVWIRGQLRTVGSLAEGMEPEDVAAFKDEVARLSVESTKAAKDAQALSAALDKAVAVDPNMYGYDLFIKTLLAEARVGVTTIAEAQAKLDQLREVSKQSGQAARALQQGYGEATDAMLADVEGHQKAENVAVATGVQEKIELQQEYRDATIGIHGDLSRELASIGASDAEREQMELEDRQEGIRDQYQKQIEAARSYYSGLIQDAKGNTARQQELEQQFLAEKQRLEGAMQEDLVLTAQIAAERKKEAELDAARKAADAKQKEEERIYGIINGLEEKGLSNSELLALEKARTLAGIDDEYGAEKARIAAAYDAEITAAQEEEEQARRQAQLQTLEQTKDRLKSVVDGFQNAMQQVSSALNSAFSAATGFVDFFAAGLETLTGFSFNLTDAINQVVDGMEEASSMTNERGLSMGVSDAGLVAQSVIREMVDGAVVFVEAAVAAIPSLLDALIAQLPTLINALVEAIPLVVDALAAALPGLIDLFVQSAPKVIEALVAGIPQIVEALVNGLPQIVDMLIGLLQSNLLTTLIDAVQQMMDVAITEIPRFLVAFIEQIPGLFQNILAHLPDVIKGLIAGIADVVVAIIEAIPEIVSSLIQALPGIITSLLDSLFAAIPNIILALSAAIPDLIGAIVGGIPEIFSAILSRIPMIITTLIGMIPDLFLSIIQGLPDLLPAFIGLIPDLISALVIYMPQIAWSLVKALIVELPKEFWQMAPAIGWAIVDAIKSAWDALVEAVKSIFQAAWDAITSLFGGGGGGDQGAAYSGIDYVPATMRMTLHPGEAVIPASRNPANRGRRADPGLAGGRAQVDGFMGGNGGGQAIQLLMNGRVIQDVMLEANSMGQTPKLSRLTRGVAGIKPGFDRGPFQKY